MPEPTARSTSHAASATLAALERYQLHATRLAADWLDMEMYRQVAADVDEVRRHCEAIALLSGPWIALLIAHAELMNGLWHSARPGNSVTERHRRELLAQALARSGAIRNVCMQLLGFPGGGGR